ncbi:MAG: hypothetical protein HY858_13625 [Candidatus Solibacter usitatus]|nr:hypothetical protein [Candidatus Solibacter usitatus]
MNWRIVWVLAALLVLAAPAWGTMQCILTAVPLQVSSEGLAEPVGEVMLNCAGGVPLNRITGTLQFTMSRKLANYTQDGNLLGITLSVDTFGIYLPLPVNIRPLENYVVMEGIDFNLSPQGTFKLKLSGVRAEAGGTTTAALQFYGNEQFLVPSPVVTVAVAQPTMQATSTATAVSGPGPVRPTFLDFSNMIGSQAPSVTTRVTESWGAAFVPRGTNITVALQTGLRIMIKFSGVPRDSHVFGPDAIAGSSALQPTMGLSFGGNPTGGLYNPVLGQSLLLTRVPGAAADGSGGFPYFVPGYGPQTLFGVGEAEYSPAGPYLVYEVLDSNTAMIENAQIPAWIFLPSGLPNAVSVVKQTVSLAPISDVSGTVPVGGAIPRYRLTAVQTDCGYHGDCNAPYFPKLKITPTGSTAFTAASGSGAQIGNILVHNDGGSVLEWQATVRYRSQTGWLTIFPGKGVDKATLRYDVLPKNLAPGRYEADIIFQLLSSPTGMLNEVVVPVTLDVTLPLPPPIPMPVIREVVSAATRWGMPAAPGSLITLLGSNFEERTTVTVGGKAARVVLAGPQEMTAEVPMDALMGGAAVIATTLDKVSQGVWIDIVPVSPGTLAVWNENGEPNVLDRPVEAGKQLDIYVTGIRLAQQPVMVKIHDRYLDAVPRTIDQVGVDQVSIIVPEDFPTMPSVVVVCAKPPGGEAVCTHPKDIWIKAAGQ